jgi:hypothetical protein
VKIIIHFLLANHQTLCSTRDSSDFSPGKYPIIIYELVRIPAIIQLAKQWKGAINAEGKEGNE